MDITKLPATAQLAVSNLQRAGLEEIVHLPGSELFEGRLKSYWSLSPRLRPWAIVQPRTTEDVSATVKALVGTPDCQFAIRSGGHMCWPGSNGIENGVTIDLGLLDRTTYNPESKIASLQPGPRWVDVYATLEKDGVMVAGGREGLVGVGGLLLGGGISYYSCRFGFACDQIVNYEVVLADGRIINVNKNSNEDLFWALKGGGNNFGIVTRFDMQTFPARDVWDGYMFHSKMETDTVIEAMVSLLEHLTVAEKPSEHYLGLWVWNHDLHDISITSILTNLDGADDFHTKQKFISIPGQQNLKKISIATKTAEFVVQSNQHSLWLTTCFKNDRRIAKKAVNVFEVLIDHIKEHIPGGDFEAMTVLQPLPTIAAPRPAGERNMLGIERMAGEATIIAVTILQISTWELMQAIFPKSKALLDELDAYAESLGGSVEFRYGNYCDSCQNPLATYSEENLQKMSEASKKYDPTGVFQTRVPGGFKISKVKTENGRA